MLADPSLIKALHEKMPKEDQLKQVDNEIMNLSEAESKNLVKICDRFEQDLLEQFEMPILFRGHYSELGMRLPAPTSSFEDIAVAIGKKVPITLIDCKSQHEIKGYTLGDYANYLSGRTEKHKVVNLISLEFSATPLSSRIQSPKIVRAFDWIDLLWPLDMRAKGDFPRVQKYCLCGMAGSWTDFHADFGGTSVWYHIVKGCKRFYLIPPTCENLLAFQSWSSSERQGMQFFGSLVAAGNCFKLEVSEGQTLFIPGGWIHAVYTPVDSLVFGGNFLHSAAILPQLQVYVVENRTHVGKQYRFPYFKDINCLLLCSLLPHLHLDEQQRQSADIECHKTLLDAVRRPTTFKQYPYLLRTVELWQKSLSAPDENKRLSQFTRLSGCACMDDVVQGWWRALAVIADELDAAAAPCGRNMIASYRGHLELVRSIKDFDLLSPSVVADLPLAIKTKEGDDQNARLAATSSGSPQLKLKLPSCLATESESSEVAAVDAWAQASDTQAAVEKNVLSVDSKSHAAVDVQKRDPSLKLRLSASCSGVPAVTASFLGSSSSSTSVSSPAPRVKLLLAKPVAGQRYSTRGHRVSVENERDDTDERGGWDDQANEDEEGDANVEAPQDDDDDYSDGGSEFYDEEAEITAPSRVVLSKAKISTGPSLFSGVKRKARQPQVERISRPPAKKKTTIRQMLAATSSRRR